MDTGVAGWDRIQGSFMGASLTDAYSLSHVIDVPETADRCSSCVRAVVDAKGEICEGCARIYSRVISFVLDVEVVEQKSFVGGKV